MGQALREVFAAFTTRFDSHELDEGERRVDRLTRGLESLGQAVAVGAAVHGIASFVGETVEMSNELGRASTRLGITTRELQALQYAASQTGASVDEINDGLLDFIENSADAAIDGGEKEEAFHRLGISVKDTAGRLRPMNELLLEVADALSKLPDRGAQVFTARQLFGDEAGARLLPLLDQGARGIRTLTREFDRMGGGISGGTVQASAQLTRQMAQFNTALNALRSTLAEVFLPLISTWVVRIGAVVRALAQSGVVIEVVKVGLSILATVGVAAAVSLTAAWTAAMGPFALLLPIISGLTYLLLDRLMPAVQDADTAIGAIGETAERVEDILDRLGVESENASSSINQTGDAAVSTGRKIDGLTAKMDRLRVSTRDLSREEQRRAQQIAYSNLSQRQRIQGLRTAIRQIEEHRERLAAGRQTAQTRAELARLEQWLRRLRSEERSLTGEQELRGQRALDGRFEETRDARRQRARWTAAAPSMRGRDDDYEVGMTRMPGYDPLAVVRSANPQVTQHIDARTENRITIEGNADRGTVDDIESTVDRTSRNTAQRVAGSSRQAVAQAAGR